MIDTVATWDYYTDFDKVYLNVEKIKIELPTKLINWF